jgi:hypothetical protein
MCLNINGLVKANLTLGEKKGELKIPAEPAMLLKIKEERSDISTDPTMLMKIKEVNS